MIATQLLISALASLAVSSYVRAKIGPTPEETNRWISRLFGLVSLGMSILAVMSVWEITPLISTFFGAHCR